MPRNPAPAKGRQAPVPAERRKEIIDSAREHILNGKTLKDIAAIEGVSVATLSIWFHGLGDEYKDLRRLWVDEMLVKSANNIDESVDALALARAREQWRYATWYAERRDPFRYGAKGEGLQQLGVTVVVHRDGAMIDVTPQAPLIEHKGDDDLS